jgi:hypothetical protein
MVISRHHPQKLPSFYAIILIGGKATRSLFDGTAWRRELSMIHDFTPKLGRIGWKHDTRLDRHINKVMRAAQAAGHMGNGGRSGFTGARMGCGGTFGTLPGAEPFAGGQRRVTNQET